LGAKLNMGAMGHGKSIKQVTFPTIYQHLFSRLLDTSTGNL
jgi:hypothetical protein